ncbi:dihydroorotase [Pseudoroseomonas sp. WGS1072]|uniref:dihydroorotase n=1 Tax=Roseomonas sp. WGS1072 TaxID=3366816 RepID=UPI003BF0CDBA
MMPLPYDRVLRGDLVLPDGILRDGYVAVRGESIAAIGEGELPPARAVEDHSGRFILPGLVDGHMHTGSAIGWPGIEGATMSAAAGGVTTVCDMPYDVPRAVTDAAIFREKVEAVNALSHVDVALYGTIRKEGGVDAIAGLAEAGASAFKLSTYEYDAVRFPRIDHPTMTAAFREIAKTGLMVAVHNEDQELVERLTAEARASGRVDPIMHARGFEIAAAFRGMGGRASGEACIQYLCMTEEDLVRLKGFGKCNPPFRTAAEVERMWAALIDGRIAYVSTDHAPWPRARKLGDDIFACGAGLTGMQSFAPLMATLLLERGLPLTLMARYCAENTARHHGLAPRKGAIRLGADADFAVLEEGEFTFDEASIQDREDARWSPYHGRPMKVRVAATYLRGTRIWDGTTVSARPGQGRFLPRQHRESVPL